MQQLMQEPREVAAGRVPDLVALLAPLILGVPLMVAGGSKVPSAAPSALAVRAFQILPHGLAGYVRRSRGALSLDHGVFG